MGWLRRSKPSNEEMEAMMELKELSETDEQTEKAFGFIDKVSGIDMDEMEKDIEESRIKLDFVVLSIKKMSQAWLDAIENKLDYPDDVTKVMTEIDNEFKQKVQPLYENED